MYSLDVASVSSWLQQVQLTTDHLSKPHNPDRDYSPRPFLATGHVLRNHSHRRVLRQEER
jgi:hypothetical protein